MTILYSLAPNPKWYFVDMVGLPLAGGYFRTLSSLNHTSLKLVYQTGSANIPWPYNQIPNQDAGKTGILIDENGAQGPFWFAFDSATPNLNYYLEVYDSVGNLQWTIDGFTAGSGGSSTITTALNLNNLVSNNVMYRNNVGTTAVSTSAFVSVAPGANTGLVETASNASPDIVFLKNNTSATDTIQFVDFGLGDTFSDGTATPVNYFKYTCTSQGASETQKCVQFPITQGVQNFQSQQVTVSVYARGNTPSAGNTITLNWLQFFGDPSGTSPGAGPALLVTPITTYTLTANFDQFSTTTTVPSTTGGILGTCGNDGLFLQVQFPLDLTCEIDFTKAAVYPGTLLPTTDYLSYDMIDGSINTPRTGDVRVSLNAFNASGWMPMADGFIGSATSGAGAAPNNRANIDTFPLYACLWNNVSDTYAPVSGGRGATAVADFAANKKIALTKQLGRLLAGIGTPSSGTNTGTSWALGQTTGNELHTIMANELPAHTHAAATGAFVETGAGFNDLGSGTNSAHNASTGNNTTSNTAMNIQNPVAFYNIYIKL